MARVLTPNATTFLAHSDRFSIGNQEFTFTFFPGQLVGTPPKQNYIKFTTNPWVLCQEAVRNMSTSTPADIEAQNLSRAYLDQSREYFVSALNSRLISSKPLLFYYSFLNFVKAYLIYDDNRNGKTFDKKKFAHNHGVEDDRNGVADEITGASLTADNRADSVLKAFWTKLDTTAKFPNNIKLVDVVAQLLHGHRIWASSVQKQERFLNVSELAVYCDAKDASLRLRLAVERPGMNRLGVTVADLISFSALSGLFQEVTPNMSSASAVVDYAFLEDVQSPPYSQGSGVLFEKWLQKFQELFWTNIVSIPPYRGYYLYCDPSGAQRYPQLISIYTFFFYLGSITRYRPHRFENLLNGTYGAFADECISNLPNQFAYLLASRFVGQEVTRGATI